MPLKLPTPSSGSKVDSDTTVTRQTNPHGAFVVWNYKERITADPTVDPHEIEEVIVDTTSVISMSTSKNKSQPAGQFQIQMAPTHNWVAKLTPGSWCAILMSRDTVPSIKENDPGQADKRTLKMFGRITGVRTSVTVDQITGARQTSYVITGKDWGSVFECMLYIDPIARNNNYDQLSAIGHQERLFLDSMTLDYADAKNELPTTGDLVKNIIKLWGSPLANILPDLTANFSATNTPTPLFSSEPQYKMPKEVASFLFSSGSLASIVGGALPNVNPVNFASVIKVREGILADYDSYSGDTKDAIGFLNPNSLYGVNMFWQLLTENCNPTLNELIADMRWEDGELQLALYRRIRPFLTRSYFEGAEESQVEKNMSLFKNVRRVFIPKSNILTINAGTDLNEKINFIEVKPNVSTLEGNFSSQVKIESQFIDRPAYSRDGFKPLMVKPTFIPTDILGDASPLEATQWKYLLKEWHFGKDTLLNGAVSFMGLDTHIGVGDNIRLDATVLGAPFTQAQAGTGENNKAYLLAHVEQIEHNFEVLDDGARSFITTIRFVRGIISDKKGNVFGSTPGVFGNALAGFGIPSPSLNGDDNSTALDNDASLLDGSDEKHNNVNTVSLPEDLTKLKNSESIEGAVSKLLGQDKSNDEDDKDSD